MTVFPDVRGAPLRGRLYRRVVFAGAQGAAREKCIPGRKRVQAPCGARVRTAIGLAPWAAQVPPTERAGSEGSYIESLRWRGGRPAGASIKCCLQQRPLWWLAPPPSRPLRGGTMDAGQWRQFEFMAAAERKPYNRASPGGKQANRPDGRWKCTPSAAYRRRLPRRGRF